jgi:hypothetical protein
MSGLGSLGSLRSPSLLALLIVNFEGEEEDANENEPAHHPQIFILRSHLHR